MSNVLLSVSSQCELTPTLTIKGKYELKQMIFINEKVKELEICQQLEMAELPSDHPALNLNNSPDWPPSVLGLHRLGCPCTCRTSGGTEERSLEKSEMNRKKITAKCF